MILIHAGTVITSEHSVLRDAAVLVNETVIERVLRSDEIPGLRKDDLTIVDARQHVVIPGFIQTHIHLCQALFRGLAEELELLDWLKTRIYPLEAAHTEASMHTSAQIGLAELIRSGTTTIMDMGSVHHEDAVAHAVALSGMRAYLGKCLIDINDLYPPLKESTREALDSTVKLIERWHGAAGGRIRYAAAPRFVLSCTDDLLRETHALTKSYPGLLFHTHASENRKEMEAIRARCNMDNIEFFDHLGVLHPTTCLAHCIHLNEHEFDLLARSGAHVLHCPSSNLKLGSGVARVPEMLRRGISVSIGADGAPCNNSLDMFHEMRLAAQIQKPLHGPTSMPARTVFGLATLGGARALGLGQITGSIEPGKKADLVLLDLQRPWNPLHIPDDGTLFGAIVHTGTPENVRSVMVDGSWIYRDGRHTTIDPEKAAVRARKELVELLQRTHFA
jgi:cytosine/adenosine deaminase-related metal-dependent hydrolase